MKFDLLDNSLSDSIQIGLRHQLSWEALAGLFSGGGASAAAGEAAAGSAAASSAASYGAAAAAGSTFTEGAAWTFAGDSAGVAASQGGAAAGITAGQMLQYAGQGAMLLQGLSGYSSGNTNAAYAKDAARRSLSVGAANKNLRDARGRAQLGELRAQMGAQGTTLNSFSDSPMLVYLDSVRNASIESQNEYWQGQVGATGYKEQARWAKRGGEADLWSGIIGAAAPAMKSLGSRLLA